MAVKKAYVGKGGRSTEGVAKRARAMRQRAFLAAFGRTASVTRAAKLAKLDRDDHYRWLKEESQLPEGAPRPYTEAWADAQVKAADHLEDTAVRRADEGVIKAVYYKGKVVGKERVYSDYLLGMTLKAAKPERYKDRSSSEVSGPGGKAINILITQDDANL